MLSLVWFVTSTVQRARGTGHVAGHVPLATGTLQQQQQQIQQQQVQQQQIQKVEAKPQQAAVTQDAESKKEQQEKLQKQQEELKRQQEVELKRQKEAEEKLEAELRHQQEAEAELKRKQEAEAELKRQLEEAEAELKRQEEAKAELQRKQEAELKRQQEAEAELKRQEEAEAELKRQLEEAQAELKRQQEAEAEAELKRQQEAEADLKRRLEETEAELKRQEEAEAELKRQQEAELKRQEEAEAELKRKEAEEAETKRQLEEAQKQSEQSAKSLAAPHPSGIPVKRKPSPHRGGKMGEQWAQSQVTKISFNFDQADVDKNGSLSFSEVFNVLKNSGFKGSEDEAKYIFAHLDRNHDDKISKFEFTAAMNNLPRVNLKVFVLRKAFLTLDKDKSGFLTRQEILDATSRDCGLDIAAEKISDLLVYLAKEDDDQKVSFEEFLHVFGVEHIGSTMKSIFAKLDTDNSGYLTRDEILAATRKENELSLAKDKISDLLTAWVKDSPNNKINYNEFVQVWMNQKDKK